LLSKGVCSLDDNLKKEIRKIALQNAVEHDGKTKDKAVLSKSLGTIPELKSNVKDAIPEIASIVSQVNGMSIEEQKTEIENNFPEILNVKEPVKKERVGLPPLEGAEQGKVVTRFTPAPNGYPHIGHAKAAIISEEYAKMYGGKLVLRFDDTNPEDTRLEYWAAIKVGLDWLGIKFDQEKNTSDDIELFYDKCVEMIKKNNAYVCTCKRDTISKNRREMMSCECSARDVKQNVERWKQMFDKYNNPIKKLEVGKVEKINDVWTGRSLTFFNTVSNRLTNMKLEAINFDMNIKEDFLTQRALTDQAFREKFLKDLRKQAK